MGRIIEGRREFLKHASVAAALPFILGCRAETATLADGGGVLEAIKRNAIADTRDEWWGARSAPANVSWKTSLAAASEKAPRIAVTGTVYLPDGKTPAPNVLIYLYHTDVYGIYGRGSEHRHGRYRGWILTDAKGSYEFDSIMPASYPNSIIAAHIHMTVTTTDRKEDWIDSILFEGDRFITPQERTVRKGGFNPILKIEKNPAGVLHGRRDILLS